MHEVSASLGTRVHIGRELVYKSRSKEAIEVLESALHEAEESNDRVSAAKALDWLLWLALVELDGERTRAYAARMLALTVCETSPEAFRLYVRHAVTTLQLGDANGALAILERAERVSREADIESFTLYLSCKADVLAAFGHDEPALQYARLSADICGKRNDRYALWQRTFYSGYTFHAAGRLPESMEAYLRAAQVGRDASLVWEPAFATARASWVAFLLGQIGRARELLGEACRSPGSQPILRVACAWISLRLGIALGDEELLRYGADPRQLESVLRSADSYAIGPTVAAFHDYHRLRGAGGEADRLLAIGSERLTSPDTGWALFAPIARYGDAAMLVRAGHLLDHFPSGHRISRAFSRMFHAIVALRNGETAKGERLAGEAQLYFEDMECVYESARCLELSGRIAEAQRRYEVIGMHGEAARLRDAHARRGRPRGGYESTQQRREIRAMLAQGATIKSIADRLGVSDRTIKARVADIYDDEGVSTRAELLVRLRHAR